MESDHIQQNSAPPPFKRWYDKQQTLSKSVKLLETFPVEYQEILGDTIIRLAEKHCQAEQVLANLRALGPEKVLSIFKSKSRNRAQDQNDTVHKAMHYLFVLPDEERVFIAVQVIEVVGHIFEYFIICQETDQEASKEIVQDMSLAFVRGQLTDTVDYLGTFQPSMTLPNGPTLQAIRNRITQSRRQAYNEEMTQFKQNKPLKLDRPTDSKKAASIAKDRPASTTDDPQPKTKINQNPPPVEEPKPEATPAAEVSQEAPPVKVEKEAKAKDETLAQDNRGMKIKLDKFEL